jgi:flagellar motility protein MotE (MotC chaperone)
MAAVDKAVLETIEQIVCSAEDLRPVLVAEVRRQENQRLGTSDEVARLEEELATIEQRAKRLMTQLSGAFADSASEQLDTLGARKRAITERIEEIGERPSLTDEQVERFVDEIIDRLSDMLDLLWEEQDSSLRRVAETLVSSAAACSLICTRPRGVERRRQAFTSRGMRRRYQRWRRGEPAATVTATVMTAVKPVAMAATWRGSTSGIG